MKCSIVVNKGSFDSIKQASTAEADIDWWNEGEPRTVYCTECFAAVQLMEQLSGWVDPEGGDPGCIELRDASAGLPRTGLAILLGNARTNPAVRELEQMTGETVSAGREVREEGFRIRTLTCGGSMFAVLSGNDRVGTLHAAYAFLESLGFRWYGPGKAGTCYPGNSFEAFPDMNRTENPGYETRGGYSEYLDDSCDELIQWMTCNRMNYVRFLKVGNPWNLKKRGFRIGGGGHNLFYRFMDPNQEYPYRHPIFGGAEKPADTCGVGREYKGDLNGDGLLSYAEAHPEWYALVDGARRFRRDYAMAERGYFTGDNFCISNEDAMKEFCRLLVEDLISGELSAVDFLDLWPMDNGTWCQCDRCKAIGNRTDNLLRLVYRLDQAVKNAAAEGRIRRKIRIVFPAYHETMEPPQNPLPQDFDYECCMVTFFPIERCYVHAFDDSRCTETNMWLKRNYLSWTPSCGGNYKGSVFIGEYYNVSSFAAMPIPLHTIIARDLPYYYKTGTRHFYYMHITAKNWGLSTFNNYLHARLLWNPAADADSLADEYFTLYYGEAADLMKALHAKLEKAMSNMKYIKHYQQKDGKEILSLWGGIAKDEKELFPLKHVRYSGSCDDPNAGIGFTDTLKMAEECRYILDDAILKAGSGQAVCRPSESGEGEAVCRPPEAGDGPAEQRLPEARAGLTEQRLPEARAGLTEQRLLEARSGLEYGYRMLQFYYHMVRTSLFRNCGKDAPAFASFQQAKAYAELLRKTTGPLEGYYYGKEFENGLAASWMEKTYRRYAEEYEGEKIKEEEENR